MKDFGQQFFFGISDMIWFSCIAFSTDTAVWTANPDGLLMGFIKEIPENLYILLGYGENALKLRPKLKITCIFYVTWILGVVDSYSEFSQNTSNTMVYSLDSYC